MHAPGVPHTALNLARGLAVCNRIVNGDVPPDAVRWLTSQKVVALRKMSHPRSSLRQMFHSWWQWLCAPGGNGLGGEASPPLLPFESGRASAWTMCS